MKLNQLSNLTRSLKSSQLLYLTAQHRRQFLTANFPELKYLPKSIDSHQKLYKYSIDNSDEFWSIVGKKRVEWFKEFTKVTSGSFHDANFHLKWFIDGKLNVSG